MPKRKPTFKHTQPITQYDLNSEIRRHRHPRYIVFRNEKYLDWIRKQECVICGASGPSDPNHLWASGGGGGKYMDYLALPFCRLCHHNYHALGHDEFERQNLLEFELEVIKYLSFYRHNEEA